MDSELENRLHNNISYYFGNKEVVWGIHITVGLLFIALFAIYMSYKDKQDQDSVNTKNKLTEATFYILFVLGILMFFYHGHLASYSIVDSFKNLYFRYT